MAWSRRLKMQDWKMQTQRTGVENTGVKNSEAGVRDGKTQEWKCRRRNKRWKTQKWKMQGWLVEMENERGQESGLWTVKEHWLRCYKINKMKEEIPDEIYNYRVFLSAMWCWLTCLDAEFLITELSHLRFFSSHLGFSLLFFISFCNILPVARDPPGY